MKQPDTICHKVDECVSLIQHAIDTGELNTGALGDYLHKIRQDAQKMEEALRNRKAMMEKAGIESLYQTAKGKHVPQGINKIPNEAYMINEHPKYELIVKNGDEIMYQNKVESGVLCAVEKFEGMDEEGYIRGQTQTFFFGGIVAYWYAYDQLRQAIEGKALEISGALKELRRKHGL